MVGSGSPSGVDRGTAVVLVAGRRQLGQLALCPACGTVALSGVRLNLTFGKAAQWS